jgi:hypothetical protein
LLAALALLVQALLPGAVMARPVAGEPLRLEICSADGVKTVALAPSPETSKGFAGFKCADCVFAAVAATVPAPVAPPAPVRYAGRAVAWASSAQRGLPSIRGPPRPPARAPPVQV